MIVYYMTITNILRQFGIFYGNLVYFMAIWYILWQFGIFYGNLVYFVVYFSPFGMFEPRKIWQPCRQSLFRNESFFFAEKFRSEKSQSATDLTQETVSERVTHKRDRFNEKRGPVKRCQLL
jgi:hypothetical protein